MHLKTLTVRGFKSFAGATTFRFESGMTAVVGPNGSGKSNVVDAIAWVLGEQGAKALRGGQMSDVIFAGTPARPALGRAEVTLTIDNADGALPIEYAEVSISRLLYRSGESEYAINGTACRLLDVQELMSDSGIGRELHVIVGQGQLDAVLSARPEERRAFIEEAAGVLKHRKRKERALRKVEATAANLARLTDLTAELRRQLGPLGRQAQIARRAGAIQAALRDARLRLLADDLAGVREEVARTESQTADARGQRAEADAALAGAREREALLEARIADGNPELARAQELYFRLSGTAERLRGLRALAEERARHLAEPLAARGGREPAELAAEAAEMRLAESRTGAELVADTGRLDELTARRLRAEEELAAFDRAREAASRADADRREGVARLTGEAEALEARLAAGLAATAAHETTVAAATAAAETARAAVEEQERATGLLEEGEHGLDEGYERAAAARVTADGEVERWSAARRAAERVAATQTARAEALALSLQHRDGAPAVLAGADGGRALPTVLRVTAGYEAAVSAALGRRADAVVVPSLAAAARALDRLRDDDAGRASLLVAGAHPTDPPSSSPPPAGVWAADLVSGPPDVLGPVRRALADVVVVPDLASAAAAVEADPALRAVTHGGDLLGADWADGGSAGAPSAWELAAALDEATAARTSAAAHLAEAEQRAAAAAATRDEAAAAEADALAALHASDARLAAAVDRLAQLARSAAATDADLDRAVRRRDETVAARVLDEARLAELRDRLAVAAETTAVRVPAVGERDGLATSVAAARGAEVDARLAVRTGEERARGLASRADELERAAVAEQAARDAASVAAGRRAADAAAAGRVAGTAAAAVALAEESAALAAQRRDRAAAARTGDEGELLAVRSEVRALADRVEGLREADARAEVTRAEHRLRAEALEQRAVDDHGIDAATLLAEFGPQCAVPPDADAPPDVRAVPYDRAVQERRAQQADRQLAQLGRVNPLALEEFAAMEERHAFLATQLDDLTRTRKDLLGIVREVDAHIEEVFRAAYADTAREFAEVFAVLFPGGSGHLELTDPDDLMATGIEVAARPAGKRVSRLSLLSGGERSLAAIALLVAIFRARPSPFYVFDEIEAALDDRNLQRLLACLDGLREHSQLIVITHQKRTMEIADALYGVSMRGDGISAVISQRLREPEPEPV